MKLEFEIEGEKQMSRRLRGIRDNVTRLRVPFSRAGKKMMKTFENDVFETEGRAVGEDWQPLSPYTVLDKASKGYGNKGILERTGKMKNSFKMQAFNGGFRIFNTTDYFKYHQSNQSRSSTLPRRVMLKLTDNHKETIVKEVLTFIRNGF